MTVTPPGPAPGLAPGPPTGAPDAGALASLDAPVADRAGAGGRLRPLRSTAPRVKIDGVLRGSLMVI
jgi:hypothetical protein